MKVVNFDDLSKSPDGSIFFAIDRDSGLCRKVETYTSMRGNQAVRFHYLEPYLGKHLDNPHDPEYQTDCMSAPDREDERFAVYESNDLDRLAVLIGRGPGWVAQCDHDAVAYARRTSDHSITLDEVRAATSTIKGSMADAVIEDRSELEGEQ